MLFEKVTSATVMPFSMAASMSTWSEPIPTVTTSLSSGALCDPLRIQVAGPEGLRDHDLGLTKLASQHRVGPFLSEVTISLCPRP
jgi:hypothetical protein